MPVLAPMALLSLHAAGFWPVWSWYLARLHDSPHEAWGLAALLGAAWAVFRDRHAAPAAQASLAWPTAATVLYAAAFPWLPPLPRAAVALAALAALLPALGFRRRAAWQAMAFLLLSLPVSASLQFYLGYPLRVLSGAVAAQLIHLAGYPAALEGTLLLWQGRTVLIDAPCSGINMLWAGLLLAAWLGTARGCGPLGLAAWAAAATGAVVAGNILRTSALFFLEAGVVPGPAWAHAAAGLAAFLAAAGGLLALERRLPVPRTMEVT